MYHPVVRMCLAISCLLCGCADNRAPVFDPALPDRTVTVGQTLSFEVRAVDRDGDPVAYGARGLPAGSTFDRDASPPLFRWSPLASDGDGAGRLHPVVFIAEDDSGARVEERVLLVVFLGDSRPRFTSPGAYVLDLRAGPTLDVQLTVRDDDSTRVTFALTDAPTGAELIAGPKDATLRWTPNEQQLALRRVFGVTVVATDDRGERAEQEITVVVDGP